MCIVAPTYPRTNTVSGFCVVLWIENSFLLKNGREENHKRKTITEISSCLTLNRIDVVKLTRAGEGDEDQCNDRTTEGREQALIKDEQEENHKRKAVTKASS